MSFTNVVQVKMGIMF